jgi:hypothetical protein
MHFRNAYNVPSSQATQQNIYILRLPNIHHKKKVRFHLMTMKRTFKKRYINTYFIEEISAINEHQYEDFLQSEEDTV